MRKTKIFTFLFATAIASGAVASLDLVRGGVLEFEMEDGTAPVEPLPAFPDAKMPDVSENPIFGPIVPGGNRLFNSSFELGLCGWCLVCNTRYDKAAEGEIPSVTFDRTEAKHGRQSLKVDTRTWKKVATLNSHDCYGRPGEKLTFSAWVKAAKPVTRVRASFGDATADFAANGGLSWYSPGGSLNIGTDWTRVSFTTRQPLNAINRKAVLKIDLPPDNVYWIDAAKVEVGETATDYAPMAETESANVVKETVIVHAGGDGRHALEFRGVDYRTDEVVVEQRPFAVTRYGSQRLGGKWRGNWTLPEYVAIVRPLAKNPLRANPDDPGFFLGVNGGLVRSSISGGAVWLIGAAGVETSSDFAKRVRLGGNAMLRTQDIGCQWVDFEYERGVYKWDYLDQILPAVAAADVEPLFVLGGSAFMAWVDPKKDGKRRDWYVRKNSREARKHGFYNAKKNTGAKSRVPSDDDWIEHLTGIYNHYRGVVNWYEPINEPNLQLADARDYADLLKLSYKTLKGLDPKLKVVGICATGDFGGKIGEYVDAIGKEGGFQHLDYMSFHPYNAPVDYLKNSAEKQLAAITALCEKYRPGVPRMQDEIYYLGDNAKNKGAFSGRNWPAGNIVRRAALDLAAGCVASISIHTSRYADGDACHPRHSNGQYFNFRFAPSDAYAAQNFCAFMLEGARRPRKPDLPDGLNGVTAVRPDGREVTVVWFRQPGGSRTIEVAAGAEVYDLYGNPIAGTSLTVTDDPVYLVTGRTAERAAVKVIFDTDMLTDFDDVGALACLHALADAGECEILATVSCTRGNASVAAVEVINSYYGRPDLPVGSPKGTGVIGAHVGAKDKVDPKSPLGTKAGGDGGHYKYRKLAADYPQWVRHLDADDAPDATDVYRKALAAAPDGSVVICTVGFLTNLRNLLESKPDGISPLNGRALVARKVKRLVSMACAYPRGKEYNSMWDWKASKVVFESWPTPIMFSDWQYGGDLYAGRAVAEMEGPRNPVKDVFAGNVPSRDEIRSDPAGWQRKCFGMGGRAAWDETAVLAAVRGEDRYFNVHRGTFRMIGEKGEDEWIPDEENGRHLRLTEKVNKLDVGKVIDELICRKPKKR